MTDDCSKASLGRRGPSVSQADHASGTGSLLSPDAYPSWEMIRRARFIADTYWRLGCFRLYPTFSSLFDDCVLGIRI